LKSKILKNSIIYYLFFLLPLLMPFFPILPNQTCQNILNIFVVRYYTGSRFYHKNILNFCVALLYGSEILSKNSPKLWFFLEKKLRYFNSKISTKFHRLLFLFYFFSIFGIFFFYFTYPNLTKKFETFCSVLFEG